jgi:thioredoxin 1
MVTVKKFYATWCGPCKTLAPMLEHLSLQYNGVEFLNVNVDEHIEQVQGYGVRSVPTVIIEKNGVEVKRFVGVQPIHTYANAINESL